MIGPVGTTGAALAGVGAAQPVKPKPPGVEAASSAKATPTPASELAALGAPVDTARVAELRSAIAEGRYAVDSRAVADAMIESER